jgi:hypothetical protein
VGRSCLRVRPIYVAPGNPKIRRLRRVIVRFAASLLCAPSSKLSACKTVLDAESSRSVVECGSPLPLMPQTVGLRESKKSAETSPRRPAFWTAAGAPPLFRRSAKNRPPPNAHRQFRCPPP